MLIIDTGVIPENHPLRTDKGSEGTRTHRRTWRCLKETEVDI